jgi:hypothetical protein
MNVSFSSPPENDRRRYANEKDIYNNVAPRRRPGMSDRFKVGRLFKPSPNWHEKDGRNQGGWETPDQDGQDTK